MRFANDHIQTFKFRRRAFSLLSALVAIGSFGALAFMTFDDAVFGKAEWLVLVLAIGLLFLLKRHLWRCPACDSVLEMGGIHVQDLKRSHQMRCKRCGASLQ